MQTTGGDIWGLTPQDGGATPLVQTQASERDAKFSPDGRWIAYSVSEGGGDEVYVTAVLSLSPTLTVGGGPWRVSSGGGRDPRWRADGREIYYAGPRSYMAVEVSSESGFTARPPVAVLGERVTTSAMLRSGFVDVSRDGREFLIARPVSDGAPRAPVNVLLNWTPRSAVTR
jgi:Tol biopolymer transport system component